MCGLSVAVLLLGTLTPVTSESNRPLIEMRLRSGGDVGDVELPILNLVVFPNGRAVYLSRRNEGQTPEGKDRLVWTEIAATRMLPELKKLAREMTKKADQTLGPRCLVDAVQLIVSYAQNTKNVKYCSDGSDWFVVGNGTEEHLAAIVAILRRLGHTTGTEVSPRRLSLKRTSGYSARCVWPDGVGLGWTVNARTSDNEGLVYVETDPDTAQQLLSLHGCPTRLVTGDTQVWILQVEPVF